MKKILQIIILLTSILTFSQEKLNGKYCSIPIGESDVTCIDFKENNHFEYSVSGCLGISQIGTGNFELYISPKLKSSVFKIKLDRLGSAVWMQIDGEKNVQAIINNLEAKLGEEIQPVSERVTKFLFQLYEQRLISFNELK